MNSLNLTKLNTLCIKITDGAHYSPEGITKGFPMLSVKDMRDNWFDYSVIIILVISIILAIFKGFVSKTPRPPNVNCFALLLLLSKRIILWHKCMPLKRCKQTKTVNIHTNKHYSYLLKYIKILHHYLCLRR